MTTLNSRLQLAVLNRKKGRNLIEKGFTLVELMIVIVIVGILSSVALPNFLSQTSKAKATECTSKLGSILSQVGSEALLSEGEANLLAGQLKTASDSSECTFTVNDINATDIFVASVVGAGEIAGEYSANGCVAYKTGARDIKTATGTSTAATAVCS
jgi:type IV pilus assembly protein PilA